MASTWPLGHKRTIFLEAGAAWKLTRMLSDPSAETKGLGLSLCTEMGKCPWMGNGIDDSAPVYVAGNHVTRVNSFCVLDSMLTSEDVALVTLQHRTALAWGQFGNLMDHLRSRDSSMDARLAGITPPPGGHRDTHQGS